MFQRKKVVSVLLGLALVLLISIAVEAQKPTPDFQATSSQLALMSEFFGGGYSEGKIIPITFDNAAAREQGFLFEDIQLAEELTAFTNDIIAASAKVGTDNADVRDLDVDITNYPVLEKYFSEATKYSLQNATRSDSALSVGTPTINSLTSELICGALWNPVPARQKTWYYHPTTFSTRSAAETKLREWGYHSTVNLAGGGFTRPQTYNWTLCGFNTFRDHAYPYSTNGRWKIAEQNYTGSIPGEPNPEVYASGPWPYRTWPAYVYWWHVWGPGA